jgi:RNA polymerase sigma factor (sigma-70 family)
MAKAPLEGVFHHIRKMVDAQTLAEATDEQLVERFARGHEEPAFAALLKRHGPMVLSVSQGILRQLEDAEDFFQATFLLLARKASSIRKRASVASWLHGVAYRLAMKARAQRSLRRSQEIKASAMRKTGPSVEQAWQELRPVLDEEMEKLPESYRTALILCYLEGKTHEEVARELGCPLGTVRSRVGRGRKLLQERLTGRGLTLSAGSFTTFLVAGTTSATLRAQLLDSTLKACLQFVTGRSAAALVSAPVAALVAGGLKAMLLTKLKIATAFLLAVSFVAGAGALAHQVLEAKPSEIKQDTERQPAAQRSDSGVQEPARTDFYGDPLPRGAIARIGTIRLRPGSGVGAMSFSPDGKTLASVDQGVGIHLWNVATGKEIRRFAEQQHAGFVTFSPDGQTLASATDKTVCLWDMATGREIRQFIGHPEGYTFLALAPDGKTLASASISDKTVRLWEVATGKEVRQLQHTTRVFRLAWSPDGKTLAAGCESGLIYLWEATSEGQPRFLIGHQDMIGCLVWSHDSILLASGGSDGTLRLWDPQTGKERRTIGLDNGGPRQLEKGVGKGTANAVGSLGSIHGLVFSLDDKTVFTASQDYKSIYGWDVATGKQVHRLTGAQGIFSLCLSPDGKTLAAGGAGGMIDLWDLTTNRPVHQFGGHQGRAFTAVFSPDGKIVASGGDDQVIRLWEVGTWRECGQLTGHQGPICSLAFSGGGKMLASCSFDETVRIWDLGTGKEARAFAGELPHSVALSPDG